MQSKIEFWSYALICLGINAKELIGQLQIQIQSQFQSSITIFNVMNQHLKHCLTVLKDECVKNLVD